MAAVSGSEARLRVKPSPDNVRPSRLRLAGSTGTVSSWEKQRRKHRDAGRLRWKTGRLNRRKTKLGLGRENQNRERERYIKTGQKHLDHGSDADQLLT